MLFFISFCNLEYVNIFKGIKVVVKIEKVIKL